MSIQSQLSTRYSESAALLQRALTFIPGACNSWTRWTDYPLNPAKARGSRLWDVDGREYLDCLGAYNAIVLGHSYPAVVNAVAKQMNTLILAGINRSPVEVELAERLVRHIPCAEQALLAPCGSDATYNAIRLARAVTERSCVVKFEGSYHGPHDYVLRTATDADRSGAVGMDGVLIAAAETVLVCPYNDLEAVRGVFLRRGHEIAAIIVEPIAFNANLFPEPGFLAGLRQLTTEFGSLLIFDEVITGFRVGMGGAQAAFDVMPDLTTVSKALGNGFPIAALAGPERYMGRFATNARGTVPYSGTHNGNGVAVAAANATLEVMENEPVHERLSQLGDRMRAGLQRVTDECGLRAVVIGAGSIYNLLPGIDKAPKTFADVLGVNEALFLAHRNELIRRGVLEMPVPLMRSQLTYSHTDEDVDHVIEATRESLVTLRSQAAFSPCFPG